MNKISKMKENISNVDKFLLKYKYLNTCLVDCTDCCSDYFYASLPEFLLTLEGLLKLPTNLDFYYHKAMKSYTYFSEKVPLELERLDPLTSNRLLANLVVDFSEGEFTNYPNLNECVMLNNGRCSVYSERPNTCRKYGTTITCEYLNNKDYRYDDFTNYHLYPLIENTELIHENQESLVTFKYPLWFYYSYFFRKEFRGYILDNLKIMKSMSESEFINYINSK